MRIVDEDARAALTPVTVPLPLNANVAAATSGELTPLSVALVARPKLAVEASAALIPLTIEALENARVEALARAALMPVSVAELPILIALVAVKSAGALVNPALASNRMPAAAAKLAAGFVRVAVESTAIVELD